MTPALLAQILEDELPKPETCRQIRKDFRLSRECLLRLIVGAGGKVPVGVGLEDENSILLTDQNGVILTDAQGN